MVAQAMASDEPEPALHLLHPGVDRRQGMDQTFNFRAAPVPLHRRLSPRAIALVVTACLMLSGLVSFSVWVIDSERRSMARAQRADAPGAIIGTLAGSEGSATGSDPLTNDLAIDAAARADARSSFELARSSASGRATFLDAGPGQLGALSSSLVFVDGPASGPGVVSIASTAEMWGAAVAGPSGTCYLLRFATGEGLTYGSGAGGVCTGDEALAARDTSW
jgi:hypothetical protein